MDLDALRRERASVRRSARRTAGSVMAIAVGLSLAFANPIPRVDPATPADAGPTLHLAMLQLHDAEWSVAPGTVTATRAQDNGDLIVELASPVRRLRPIHDSVAVAGAPIPRASAPLWSHVLDASVSAAPSRGDELWEIDIHAVRSRPHDGWNELAGGPTVAAEFVFIPAGFQPRQWDAKGRRLGIGRLPVACLTADAGWTASNVDSWRRRIAENAEWLAETTWNPDRLRTRDHRTTTAILAGLLGVKEAAPALRVFDDDQPHLRHALAPAGGMPLRGALALLDGRTNKRTPRHMAALANHFASPPDVLATIARDASRAPAIRVAAKRAISHARGRWPDAPSVASALVTWLPWITFTLLLVPLGLVGARRPKGEFPPGRVRRRDAGAFALAALVGAVGVEFVFPLTSAELALVVMAAVVARMRRDPRTGLSLLVPTALAAAAILTALGAALASPPVDALGRLCAFGSVGWIAVCGIEPRRIGIGEDAPPRTPARPARFEVVQVVALALFGALVLTPVYVALLADGSWPRTPDGGLVAIGALLYVAGLVAWAAPPLRGRPRPWPLACVAVAFGAWLHPLALHASVFGWENVGTRNDALLGGNIVAAILVTLATIRIAGFVWRHGMLSR